MAADALAPCIDRSSVIMILDMQDKQSCLPKGRVSTTCTISVSRNDISANAISIFLVINSAHRFIYLFYILFCYHAVTVELCMVLTNGNIPLH